MLDHMYTNIQKHHKKLSVGGHLGMQVCSLSGVFFFVGELEPFRCVQLQSKMAWNVDAVVRYYLSVATEYLVFNFSILFAVVGS